MNKYRDYDGYLKEFPTPVYHCQTLSEMLGKTQFI